LSKFLFDDKILLHFIHLKLIIGFEQLRVGFEQLRVGFEQLKVGFEQLGVGFEQSLFLCFDTIWRFKLYFLLLLYSHTEQLNIFDIIYYNIYILLLSYFLYNYYLGEQ
jgi:hypothetical protein